MITARTFLIGATVALTLGAIPARAQQVDLAGMWSSTLGNHEELPLRGDPGVEVGEYVGIPLNDAARQHAESWTPTMHSLLEWQGRPHPVTYSMRAPRPDFRMGAVVDPKTERLIAYTITGLFGRADRTIWLDGRPHPSKYAEHLWQGFSTGEWVEGGLKVTTTHIKYSFVHRNGIPLSPYAAMTEYYWRHGDFLTLAIIVEDPIYLTEPLVRTATFKRDPNLTIPPLQPFEVAEELPSLEKGQVPAYPLGTKHPEYADRHKLPFEASQGGAQTMYPEYMQRLDELKKAPASTSTGRVASSPAAHPVKPAYDDGNVEVIPVQGNVHVVAGSGANITVQIDSDGVLIVDSSVEAMSEKVLAAIRKVSDKPIRQIINTSADDAHTGGNESLSNAGRNVSAGIGGQNGREPARLEGAPVIAHELVLHRMSGLKGEPARMPYGVWPHDTFYTNKKQIYFGGEVVEMLHTPAAHTDGDLLVWFRKSDVVATGDVFSTVSYPMIDRNRGGSIQGILDALNQILDITFPAFNNQGGTLVVPGHGRICNESDVAEYRDMTTIIRDRIQLMIDKKMTLAQIKAAGPTKDYDGVYSTPSWTGEMFIEAIYADLTTRR
jgi:glyoxylase-like metal-dependent hydrolase (beta-lactamase superfamily II)